MFRSIFIGFPSFMEPVAEQIPSYGTLASSGVMTTLSTCLRGTSKLAPPPRLMSIWDLPRFDFPVLQQQQVTSPPYRPPLGRGEQLSE